VDPDAWRQRRRAEARRRTLRQRRLALAVAVGAAAAGVAGIKPRRRRLRRAGDRGPVRVAFYGAPQNDELGALGVGSPAAAARRLERQARPYRRGGRPVLPAFELIATIVHASPGADGDHSERQTPRTIRRYLRAARRHRALLILDIQPGFAPFMREVRAFGRFLEEPDVSLALDPEWSMTPGQIPGQQIGSTDATVVKRVSR
jgi:hypothetical protein